MTSNRVTPSTHPRPDAIHSAFEDVLIGYWKAKTTEKIGKAHPVCVQLASVARQLSESKQVRRFPGVVTKWSAGQGNWATIPWIAALDSRETVRTSHGVYVVYLFRADMSGLYLTLNQGTTQVQSEFGKEAHRVLRERAALLRKHASGLPALGFDLTNAIELRNDSALVRGYEAATVAHKLYERSNVPADTRILEDLAVLLDVYDKLVPSERILQAQLRRRAGDSSDEE